MTTIKNIEHRKDELSALEVNERLNLWLKIHKDSERYHKLFGITGIICAAVSSQLSEYPHILLFTGLTAAISTALLSFLNMKTRSITYINAWRILDKANTAYLCDEKATLESVGKAISSAEEYIQNALHKT